MAELRLDQVARKIRGEILQGAPSLLFHKFNIDSRLTEPGELFFALIARRNGHDFIRQAADKGARGAVISQTVSLPDRNFALIRVNDTLEALQALAGKVLSEHSIKVVGITGSIGKTTVKEFTAALLARDTAVLKSEGNFNNHLGLALSLLRLEKFHQVAVLEMGTSAPGEIRALTRIAPPDVPVLTNIHPVHLEFFNTLENIALAKKEILEGTKPGGTAVLNGDDPLVQKVSRNWNGKKIYFGFSPRMDIQARNIKAMGYDGITFDLKYGKKKERLLVPVLYESYLYNLLAALGVAYALAFPMDRVVGQVHSLKHLSGRGIVHHMENSIAVIDDTYNSNPVALESALKGLAALPAKRKVAVLGDMLELGENEKSFHTQAGKQVVDWGWNLLVTVGPLSRHMAEGARAAGMSPTQIYSFPDSDEASAHIMDLVREGDLLLVKGSRGIKTEKIIQTLMEKLKER
ncbi:MAG: UDP-N-acetylmuramoyl-tripeptide--D-alanyl-D-alanine ligase [Candidatus Aminicenantales bacterium]